MDRLQEYAPYKSGFERDVAAWMTAKGVSFDYEPGTLHYAGKTEGFCRSCSSTDVARTRHYNPDFRVYPNGKLNPNGQFYLETKGKFTSEDRTKMLAVAEQHPKEVFRMLFMYDNKLNKASKNRYSDWCKRVGMSYAVGKFLPDSWIKKAKRAKKPVVHKVGCFASDGTPATTEGGLGTGRTRYRG